MCARYSLVPDEFRQIRIEFKLEIPFDFPERFNIAPSWAPGHEAPIIVLGPGAKCVATPARFWMIPSHWKRPLKELPTAFNARSEDIGQRPFWSRSFDSKRCLIPATGWREFQGASGHKRAYQFHHKQGFAFAGLWDEWQSSKRSEAPVASFAIITVPASDSVRPIHSRMPLCVPANQYDSWLDPAQTGASALAEILAAPMSEALSEPENYECDPVGNDSRREGPECIAPVNKRQLSLFD